MTNHNHGHPHEHGFSKISSSRIFWVILLNLFITASEIAGGIIANSLSLLSDAMHNLSDSFSIFVTFIGMKISEKEKNSRKTFGYKRAEILAALLNGSLLIGVSVFLFIEAFKRFINPRPVESNILLIIAVLGFLGNLISVIILMKNSKDSLNVRSSFIHLISDTLSSVAVIIGALLMKFYKIYQIDPFLSVLIALYVLFESWKIIRESVNILMQSAPEGIDIQKIKEDIEKISGIGNIHHVHIWLLDDSAIHFECHVNICEDMNQSQSDEIRGEIERILQCKYSISHTTMQFEFNSCKVHNLIGE
jgi:cobalt-zinc-cadmium efflux system protein